ncbi:uncharacterized protein LOC113275419 isoform X2 [Papaver somniferum]|uniref:uncharacterized protein LOC113275419 isoform X2 n=1 Tax=Papaver somniferum TaxID=3469 RepID=UPI000E7049F4|nr:uncharacterized protein LOC113275419 isoform X2 [Papaver somniferum]
MAAVEVDENGLPMSRNSTKLGHLKGALVRTHVPISYKTWKEVPDTYKEDVWNELQISFLLPDTSKATVIKGMSDPWRRHKWELRIAYYDPYPTYEARTSRTPPNVTDEDWQTFCRNEEDEKVQKNRVDNKRNREKYDYSHTSGRKPHSLERAELELGNPGAEITTSDVWIKAHTQEGGKILPSAQKYYVRILLNYFIQPHTSLVNLYLTEYNCSTLQDDLKKAQLDIKEKQDSGSSVDESDPLTLAFGKDTRGRVRSVGAVSRTQYDYSAPARAKVAEMKSRDGELKHQVNGVGNKMGVLIESFGVLCQTVKDIQSGQASYISSNHMESSQGHACSPAHTPSAGNTSSPAHISVTAETISPARSAVGSDTKCSLVNINGETIAVGRLCTGESAKTAHGSLIGF